MAILAYYIETFEIFRNNLEVYFKSTSEPILWNFHDDLVFGRLMDFEKRMREIKVATSNLNLSPFQLMLSHSPPKQNKYFKLDTPNFFSL